MNKQQIIFRFVNTEHSGSLLRQSPHRHFGDLSILYYESYFDNKIAFTVKHCDADEMGLSESELYDLAVANTKRLCPVFVKSLTEFLRECGEEVAEVPEEEDTYIISNMNTRYGAISILYKDVLEQVANKTGTDLYLLPSSVHEFLATPVDGRLTVEQLEELIHFTNVTQVQLNERLSNQVYHYDKETKQITQVTHSQYKRLDSVREEWFDESEEMEEDNGGMRMEM